MTPGEFIAAFDVIAEAPGGIERLRELVLQLAVRGRLVPQDEGEESPISILERNAKEKRCLVDQRKISKPKSLPSLSLDEVPFNVPETWQWIRLGDVALVVMGNSPPGSSYNEQGLGVPLINGPVEFSTGAFGLTICRKYTTKPNQMCMTGDMLICVRGATTGRTNIAAFDACIGRGVALVRAWDAQQYVNLYLWYVGKELLAAGKGTTFPSISYADLAGKPLPLPPLAEQHRIVAKVDELMGLIDRLEAARRSREDCRTAGRDSALAALRNAATSEEVGPAWTRIAERMDELFTAPADLVPLREAVLQLAVRGRLVPQDGGEEPASQLLEVVIEEKANLVKEKKLRKRKPDGPLMSDEVPFEIPQSWIWARLHDLAHDLGQKVPDETFSYIDVSVVDNKRGLIPSEVPVLDPSAAPSRARKLVSPGSVIYSTVRPYLLNIAVIEREYSPMPIASTAFAVLHPYSGVHSRLLFFWLRSPFFIDFVTAQMKGVAYPAISDTDLLRAPVPLPPTAEQHRIVAKVDELMGLIDRLEGCLVAKEETQGDFVVAAVYNF